MLVTLILADLPARKEKPEQAVSQPYKPYQPYIPYGQAGHQYASSSYKAYQPYKPYGHPDHPYKLNPPRREHEAAASDFLEKYRLALPGHSVVRRTPGRVTIDVDPSDIKILMAVLETANVRFSLDEDEIPTDCSLCGHEFSADEAKKGRCPKCHAKTCENCGELYSPKKGKCPICKSKPSFSQDDPEED